MVLATRKILSTGDGFISPGESTQVPPTLTLPRKEKEHGGGDGTFYV